MFLDDEESYFFCNGIFYAFAVESYCELPLLEGEEDNNGLYCNIIERLPILREISRIVLHHHERFDGLGYPEGLQGESIPLESRIISVVDAFDALSTDRPYRKAKNYDACFEEINLHAGSQFCPTVVRHFMNSRDIIPQVLDKFEKKEINHVAFVGHEELMHSRRLI